MYEIHPNIISQINRKKAVKGTIEKCGKYFAVNHLDNIVLVSVPFVFDEYIWSVLWSELEKSPMENWFANWWNNLPIRKSVSSRSANEEIYNVPCIYNLCRGIVVEAVEKAKAKSEII